LQWPCKSISLDKNITKHSILLAYAGLQGNFNRATKIAIVVATQFTIINN